MIASSVPGYRWAYVTFGAVWIVLSWPWLSGTVTIPYDAKALFQAQIQFLANAIHSGQSAFWNPHTFVGMPQIADPQSLIFSPAWLLAYFNAVPDFRQLDAYVLILLGLGSLAMLRLFHDRGWHPGGALVAAICFAFGASAAWRVQHIGHIQSYFFFGVALWLMARALDRHSVLWGAVTGGAVGLMLAEPNQVAFLACYVLVILVVVHVAFAEGPLQEAREIFLPLTAAAVVTILIAVIPVGLTYLFLSESNRPSIEFAEAARGSLHPASLLTFLVSDLFGALDPKVDYWGPYSTTWDKTELTLSQNMCQIYLGALPAVLILSVGGVRRAMWSREVRGYTITALAALIYALGAYTPLYGLFYKYLPGVALFRRPVDATFILGGLLAIVGGYLVHLWLTAALPAVRWRKRGWEVLAVGLFVVAGLIVALRLGQLDSARKPLIFAALWVGASALMLSIPADWLKRASVSMVVLPGLFVGLDLGINNRPNESTGAPVEASLDILKPQCTNETIRFLKAHARRTPGSPWRDRVEMLGLGFEWQNSPEVHGLDHTLGYNPLRIGLVSRAVGARDYIAGPDQRVFSPLFPSYGSRLADLLGLRYIASSVPIEQVDRQFRSSELKLVARTREAYIYENMNVIPRVMLVHAAQTADFKRILSDGVWPEFDPRTTVLLDSETAPASLLRDEHARVSAPDEMGSVAITRYQNTIVEISVDTRESGLVVLNDVWHPWWTATIDGHPVSILRANVMFRAVPVRPGRHFLRFEFHPFAGAVSEIENRFLTAGRR